MLPPVAGTYAIAQNDSGLNTINGNTVLGLFKYGYGSVSNTGTNTMGANTVPTVSPGITSVTSVSLQGRWQASSLSAQSSGSAVTAWTDTSGFGRTLTVSTGGPTYQPASTINSGPAVRFNGTNDALTEAEMSLPPATNTARTVFIVFNLSRLTTGGNSISFVNSPKLAQTDALFLNTSNVLSIYSGSVAASGLPALTASTTYVVEMVDNGSTSRIAENGTVSGNSHPGSQVWTKGVLVSGNTLKNLEWNSGDVAEISVYSGAASTADAQAIGAALCSKYNVSCGTCW